MVEVSVAIRRERREQEACDNRFLASLYRGYPNLMPADLRAANENESKAERERAAQKWFQHRKRLEEARTVVFKHAGTVGRSIINSVAEAFEMHPKELVSDCRRKRYIRARAVAIRLLRDQTWEDGSLRFSTPQIGLMFGRDHSTIVHALATFDERMKRDADAYAVYEQLSAQRGASHG